jgi:preprotein translocase subunit SecD
VPQPRVHHQHKPHYTQQRPCESSVVEKVDYKEYQKTHQHKGKGRAEVEVPGTDAEDEHKKPVDGKSNMTIHAAIQQAEQNEHSKDRED